MKPYYQKEGVTIYHGDSRDLLPQLSHVDLVVTDPPYNIGKDYGPETNDSRDPEEYWEWFQDIFSKIYSLLTDGYLYVSHSDKGVYIAKPNLETIGFEYIQTLIWWGRNGYSMQLHRKSWSYRHEPILFMQKGDPPVLEVGVPGMWYTSVIEASRPQSNFKEGRCHPTQKPVKLYKSLIARTPGDIVLDPFIGNGAVIRAARDLGRKTIGIDTNEAYCESTVLSLRQMAMKL